MQAFLSGLLLVCVSGVTVLAFKHQLGFARLFPYAIAGVTVIFVVLMVWDLAVEITWASLVEFIGHESMDPAQTVRSRLRLPYAWIGSGYIAAVVFLWINLKLPPFLRDSEKSIAGRENEDRRSRQEFRVRPLQPRPADP